MNRGIEEFLDTTRNRGMDVDCLAGAYGSSGLANAALGVLSPGRMAMVIAPWDLREAESRQVLAISIEMVTKRLFARGAQIVEALTPPEEFTAGQVLADLGFRNLTRLVYLRRSAFSGAAAPSPTRTDLEWVTFSAKTEALFLRAVESTYSQTLDCPELTGLRSMPDVLAGHRAAAEFNPREWQLAMLDGEAVGVLLLGFLPAQNALEIVYMGVSQPMRGQGVADALLARAVRSVLEKSAKHLALAVDRRNTPARSVYARWGFVETGTRDAWIAEMPLNCAGPARPAG